jgi:hypothetical protein
VSGRVLTRFELTCDGCQTALGSDGEFDNAIEARALAYTKGWRFPGRLKQDGQPTRNLVSDVCPDCIGGWKAQPR